MLVAEGQLSLVSASRLPNGSFLANRVAKPLLSVLQGFPRNLTLFYGPNSGIFTQIFGFSSGSQRMKSLSLKSG